MKFKIPFIEIQFKNPAQSKLFYNFRKLLHLVVFNHKKMMIFIMFVGFNQRKVLFSGIKSFEELNAKNAQHKMQKTRDRKMLAVKFRKIADISKKNKENYNSVSIKIMSANSFKN